VSAASTAVRIDLSTITDWDSFFDVFSHQLGFPDLFGRNMDAWIDCMTYLDEPDAGMTSVHVTPGQVLVLLLDNVCEFRVRCPEQYAALIECSAFVNWRRMERREPPGGDPPVLALAFHS